MLKRLTRKIQASQGVYSARDDQVYGLLAEFPHPGALMHAAETTRKAGYRHFDTHSPFPIHGMDRAMGLGQSLVGPIAFGGAVVGGAIGVWLQWWTGGVDYPLNVGGKPFFALEPAVPITFELTILFSAIAAVAAMLALNGLPRPFNPLFYSKRLARATDDGFFLHVAASDDEFDLKATRSFLEDLGAENVEVIRDPEASK